MATAAVFLCLVTLTGAGDISTGTGLASEATLLRVLLLGAGGELGFCLVILTGRGEQNGAATEAVLLRVLLLPTGGLGSSGSRRIGESRIKILTGEDLLLLSLRRFTARELADCFSLIMRCVFRTLRGDSSTETGSPDLETLEGIFAL